MENKDFLEQFSSNDKPDSFKEEVFVPTTKRKIHISPILIIVLVALLLLGGFLYWFFALRPTIEMPSFIGEKTSDVSSWIKQQEIQASGIVFKEEYSEEYDAKLIFEQSIEAGKKVRKDVKIDFTVSLGPDPNVSIVVPDIAGMSLQDINTWISNNKLTGVKLSYEFSDEDPLDSVIAFEFANGASESNFKRSSTVNIIVSKGKQEDQPISVPNFNNKNFSDVAAWGSKNKIKIVKKEEYSSTVNKDMVIDQSVNPGKKITSKESLVVTISKGAPIIAPDFSSYSEANILAWGTKNGVNIEILRQYSSSVDKDKVIEQSIKNAACNDGMSVTISLGNVNLASFSGTTYTELSNWIDEVNKNGAGLTNNVDTNRVNSDDFPVGQLFNLRLDGSSVTGNISKGRNIFLENKIIQDDPDTTSINESENTRMWEYVLSNDEAYARELCEYNEGLVCNFVYVKEGAPEQISKVKSIKRSDRDYYGVEAGQYISQDQYIEITIFQGAQ